MRESRAVLRAILVGLLAIAVMAIPGSDQVFAASGTWTTEASMPTPRIYPAAGVVNGILYAVGGFYYFGGGYLATVEAYDPSSNTWTTKAPMPTARCCLAVGAVNGILYAVGGANSSSLFSTVEAYDPNTNTWTTKSSMPTARYGLGVGVVNGILYAVGGGNSTGTLATVEAYDPSTDTWTMKASMPTARVNLSVGVVNGILYAVGGSDSTGAPLATVEAYDPISNTWVPKTSMPTARLGLAAGVVNGILYAVGGNNRNSYPYYLSTVEGYDPSTDTWSTGWTPMPTGRCCLGAGVVNGILYAVGGNSLNVAWLATNEAFTPPVPFAAFTAKVEINLASSAFSANNTFTLGSGGSTNPLTDPVTVQVGGFTITIPGGSFQLTKKGVYVFDGTINGVALSANLTPLGGSSYSLKLDAAGASNLPTSNPVTVVLTIGNNTGSTSVNATFQ